MLLLICFHNWHQILWYCWWISAAIYYHCIYGDGLDSIVHINIACIICLLSQRLTYTPKWPQGEYSLSRITWDSWERAICDILINAYDNWKGRNCDWNPVAYMSILTQWGELADFLSGYQDKACILSTHGYLYPTCLGLGQWYSSSYVSKPSIWEQQ